MSGMDDTVTLIGDWVPSSPSPGTFFSAMSGDESSSRSAPESVAWNETEGFIRGPKDKSMVGNPDRKCTTSPDHSAELGSSSELRLAPRGGLMERIAARAGFNAPKLNTEGIRPNDIMNPEARSPLLMLSPGLSPTTLLESPVFLSNSLVQPSPTTGKFPFVPNSSTRSLGLVSDGHDRSRENDLLEDNDSSSFAFKPIAELSSSFYGSKPNVMPTFPHHHFPRMEASAQPDASLQSSHKAEQPKFHLQAGFFSTSMMEKDVSSNNSISTVPSGQKMLDKTATRADQSSPQDEEEDRKGNGDSTTESEAQSEDGYNWRKYGQKQVKGSEYPRSYYKCTHPYCQVKKKVERSHEGHVTEIIYKGAHNHPKPPPSRRGVIRGFDTSEQVGMQIGTDADQGWGNNAPQTSAPEQRQDKFEVTSSPSDELEFCNPSNTGPQAQNGAQFEPGDAIEASSTFSNEEHHNDQANGSISLDHDAEEDVESKRRKIEAYPTDMTGATRAIREPRVVVQTTSEVDILDDGYRWRKYGQKVVKGNPNPRSYYKCTSHGCTVRKHVERASHDLKSVITTYEGKHNHDVPAARNSSHGNLGPGSTQPLASGVQAHVHQPEPSQTHNGILRFEGPGPLASFGLPGRPQPFPHTFRLNTPPGLANHAMAGLGAVNGKMPMLPIHPFLAAQQQQEHQQQSQVNQMCFMLPKGQLKPEPISDTGLNLSNNPLVYQQLMDALPLGPHM